VFNPAITANDLKTVNNDGGSMFRSMFNGGDAVDDFPDAVQTLELEIDPRWIPMYETLDST
jgi:hypothetical protein